MQIHRQHAIGAGRFEGVGTDAGTDRYAGLVFLVPFRVAEKGNDGRHLLGSLAIV